MRTILFSVCAVFILTACSKNVEYQVKKTIGGITNKEKKSPEDTSTKEKKTIVELKLDKVNLEASKKVKAGEQAAIKATINNTGKAFKGLTIELSGGAIQGKMLTPPDDKASYVSVRKNGFTLTPPKESLHFAPKNPKTVICSLPSLNCDEELIEVYLKFKLRRPGKAKVTLLVKPYDSKDKKNTIKKALKLHVYRGKGKRGSLINKEYVDPLEEMQDVVDHYSQ